MLDRISNHARPWVRANGADERVSRVALAPRSVAPVHPADALVRRVLALAVVVVLAAAVAEVWR